MWSFALGENGSKQDMDIYFLGNSDWIIPNLAIRPSITWNCLRSWQFFLQDKVVLFLSQRMKYFDWCILLYDSKNETFHQPDQPRITGMTPDLPRTMAHTKVTYHTTADDWTTRFHHPAHPHRKVRDRTGSCDVL